MRQLPAFFQVVIVLVAANSASAGPLAEGPVEFEPPLVAPDVDWEEVSLFGDVGEMLGIAWHAS